MHREPSFKLLTFIDISGTLCELKVKSITEAVEQIRSWHIESVEREARERLWPDSARQSILARLRRGIVSVSVPVSCSSLAELQAFADRVSESLQAELAVPANEHERFFLDHYDLSFVVQPTS